jgi:5-methylcytosine-specific restriction endonuclease McrA
MSTDARRLEHMFDESSPKDTEGPGFGGPVGTPEWAAGLEASGEPLGTALVDPVGPAPVPGSARDLVALRLALSLMETAGDQAEAIDRIRALERLKAACAAAQVRETATLDSLRRTADAARGVPAERQCRGLAGEVGLARSESPHRGSKHLALARALAQDLPHTLEALTHGDINEDKAAVVHRETAWLPSGHDRAVVDATMAGRLPFLGHKQLAWEVRLEAQQQDPLAAAMHWDRAAADRRVTVRPTDNGMAYLTAVIPLAQAAACHRALADTAATAVAMGEADGRTGHQVMADTLVERLTGQSSAADTPVEVQLVMTDTALLGTDDTPARFPGHGSLPAGIARDLIGSSEADVYLRRLYTSPDSGQLVAMDSRRRSFPALLRRMVVLRDDLCRTPYCDAQIRHLDHATPHAGGGETNWDNASGLCARCNHVKENPGWVHAARPDHLDVTTPTGHRYQHPTKPLTRTEPQSPRTVDYRPVGHRPMVYERAA